VLIKPLSKGCAKMARGTVLTISRRDNHGLQELAGGPFQGKMSSDVAKVTFSQVLGQRCRAGKEGGKMMRNWWDDRVGRDECSKRESHPAEG
jgi:hypothetical protein